MEFREEHIVDFLCINGGKVKSCVLLERFKAVFPEEPERRASVRGRFKSCVERVAYVKSESGVKFVCLRKRFIRPLRKKESETEGVDTHRAERAGSDATPPPPASETGSDSQVSVPRVSPQLPGFQPEQPEVDDSRVGMGNFGSCRRGNRPAIPHITVIQASPLPADGSLFDVPGPAITGGARLGTLVTAEGSEAVSVWESSEGRQESLKDEDVEELGMDAHSLSGSENNSPKGSRKHFIKVMISSSPEVRRHSRGLFGCDGEVVSLSSSHMEDDRAPVTLEPVEHEWMLCASDGEWSSLQHLLATEPSLVLRKDFVTGFTCLHWAAKNGKPELIAMIINFAKRHNVPIDVDVRSSTGYTPLHVAAMHSHVDVVKLLVGAYDADVEIRDYSGKKACQYLAGSVSTDMRDIIGAYESQEADESHHRENIRSRLSKILQSNLKPSRPHGAQESQAVDGEDGPREVVLRRKSSLSGMRPKFQRIQMRASQLVHSASFGEKKDGDASKRHSFFSRHKRHWLG